MLKEERLNLLKDFQEKLGYLFNDIGLLNKALTHKSYANEMNDGMKDNERLEFLGDAVIDLVVSDYFFKKYAFYAEGDLTRIRSALVNETSLAKIARTLDIGNFILLGKGEEMTGGREKPSILADTFEAIIASIYLDSSIDSTYIKVLEFLNDEIDQLVSEKYCYNFKSVLQEYTQQKLNCRPVYIIVQETGPDHSKCFEITVSINGKKMGSGEGKSKKEAEQKAAKNALEKIDIEDIE